MSMFPRFERLKAVEPAMFSFFGGIEKSSDGAAWVAFTCENTNT
jgi:hypothetical protein